MKILISNDFHKLFIARIKFVEFFYLPHIKARILSFNFYQLGLVHFIQSLNSDLAQIKLNLKDKMAEILRLQVIKHINNS